MPDALDLAALLQRVPAIMEDDEPWEGLSSFVAETAAALQDEGAHEGQMMAEEGITSARESKMGDIVIDFSTAYVPHS